MISYDNSYVIQYKYDANGKIAEIVEFLNEGQNTDDKQSVACNRIVFDEQGSISSVTTSVKGVSTEVIDAKTWRLGAGSYSLTVSYNDLFLCETQIIEIMTDRITTRIKYDADGIATSAITETESYDENGNSQSSTKNTQYEYEYDCNGNPVIQYSITENGKQINAVYSWEQYISEEQSS